MLLWGPHRFALILCHAGGKKEGAGFCPSLEGVSGVAGCAVRLAPLFCHFHPQQKVWHVPLRVVGPECVKGGSGLAVCLVAALCVLESGGDLDFCFSYTACGNLDCRSLTTLVNRFLTPVVTGLQQQAPFWFVFVVIQRCFQNVAA